jgi:hypothetical protein
MDLRRRRREMQIRASAAQDNRWAVGLGSL